MTDQEIKEVLNSIDKLFVIIVDHVFDGSVANINTCRDIIKLEIDKLNE